MSSQFKVSIELYLQNTRYEYLRLLFKGHANERNICFLVYNGSTYVCYTTFQAFPILSGDITELIKNHLPA